VENPSAIKLINKIQLDLFKKGFDAEVLVADLKKLREYSLEENNPALTKAIRLAYEHIEANGAFLIPIPDDEPIDEVLVTDDAPANENNIESLEYLINLFSDLSHKNNVLDLKEYNKAFLAF
jgi:hypothetical protein